MLLYVSTFCYALLYIAICCIAHALAAAECYALLYSARGCRMPLCAAMHCYMLSRFCTLRCSAMRSNTLLYAGVHCFLPLYAFAPLNVALHCYLQYPAMRFYTLLYAAIPFFLASSWYLSGELQDRCQFDLVICVL